MTKSIPSIRSSLRLLLAACLLPASLISAGWLFYDYQQNKEHLLDHAMAAASTVSLLTDKHFSNVSGTLHALATSPSLSAGDLEAFYRQAQDVLPSQDVANIVLTDRHGMQVLNTLRPFGEALAKNHSSVRVRHFGDGYRPLISDIFYGPVAGRHVIAVAVPVRRQGEVIYSLSTGMSPEPFTRLLAQSHLPPSWITAVLDSQGNFVARSRDNEQFMGQAASPALRAAIAQEEEGVLDGLALHPTTQLAVFARSPATGWTVVIGIPSPMLTKELLETLAGLGMAILLLFAFSLAVARKLGSRITHAIRSLTAPAMALGEGKSVQVPRLPLAEADEVGQALVRASDMLERARYQATHDTLTGLGNRALLYEIVSQQLALAVRNATALSVLFIDLDEFKPINDTYGHATGDRLLRHVGARLRLALRESDFAARLGGDEFAVVLAGTGSQQAQQVAERILGSLTTPCVLDGVSLIISASIGIASYPETGPEVSSLLHAADEAMYRAKSAGRNQVVTAPGAAAA